VRRRPRGYVLVMRLTRPAALVRSWGDLRVAPRRR
jgi:hypothetical protein